MVSADQKPPVAQLASMCPDRRVAARAKEADQRSLGRQRALGRAVAQAEAETWDEDYARFSRYRTPLRRRATTQAERVLLRATGVRVVPDGELFTTVQWDDGKRTRKWRRQPVVSVTEVAR